MRNVLPENEMSRIIELSSYDLDYGELENIFSDSTLLASKITGSEISLVNFIDSYTQWTVSRVGLEVDQMPREETVCQYTIAGSDSFEVKNLSKDDRFKNKSYVTGAPNIIYYFGVPLTTKAGNNLGALCILNKSEMHLDPEKKEMLKIIARDIVNRLQEIKESKELNRKIRGAKETQKKLAHDIRGPLGGIVGLAKLIMEQGADNNMEEILEINKLIKEGGMSILDLAEGILNREKSSLTALNGEYNLDKFQEKLNKLYRPQAINKKINFSVSGGVNVKHSFPDNKLLQITGNLISNALKFTPESGDVSVLIDLTNNNSKNLLSIEVKDSGVGMDAENIKNILNGKGVSTNGTVGENGFGFGLALVKHLIQEMNGHMHIESSPGQGSAFKVLLPQNN